MIHSHRNPTSSWHTIRIFANSLALSGTPRESDCVAVSSLSPSLVSVSLRYVTGLWGGREVLEGEDTCIRIADSLHYTAETNTALLSNYTPMKTYIYVYILLSR